MGVIAPVSTIHRMVIKGWIWSCSCQQGSSLCVYLLMCLHCLVSPTQPYDGLGNNDSGNILFSLVQMLYDGDCVKLLLCKVHIILMYTFSLFDFLKTATTNVTNMDWWPFTSKDTDILMRNRMNICHVDLRHAQTTKTKTNKTKTIQDKNPHAHDNWDHHSS